MTIQIEGMSCDHCVRSVRSVLEAIPDVVVRSVEVGRAVVSTPPESRGRLVDAIEGEGYRVVGR